MPISHKHKSIFVHIPKCAGSTVEKTLEIYGSDNKGNNNILDKDILFGHNVQHYTYDEIMKNVDKDVSDYFSFSFIRNPWDRMVSEFFWRKPWDQEIKNHSFSDFIERICDFDLNHPEMCPHFIEQYKFILDKNGNKLVDFIGRTENFNKDFGYIIKKLGIKDYLSVNKTVHKNYTSYYNKKTRQMIFNKYKKDIQYFDYKFQN